MNSSSGWFLRAVHNWGSIFMVGIMSLHLVQTFFWGLQIPARADLGQWLRSLSVHSGHGVHGTGAALRSGRLLGLGIGASIMGRVPLIGAQLVHLMLAGSTIAGETLSRFFSLHVFVVPGLIIALLSLHLRLVLTKGINEYPKPGSVVRKESYANEYEEMVEKTGVPFVPNVIGKDLIFSGCLIVAIVTCALVFGPAGPSGPPNPTLIHTAPKPDFYFLPIYAILALLPAYMETVSPVGRASDWTRDSDPVCRFIREQERRAIASVPMAVVVVLMAFLTVGLLAYLGTFAPWSPHMEAWSGRSHARGLRQRQDRAGAPRGNSHPKQAVPELSQPGWRRWACGDRHWIR